MEGNDEEEGAADEPTPKRRGAVPASAGRVLSSLSSSQEAVCEAVSRGASVSVLAHAGSGKTDVTLEACSRSPKATLFLEYNRSLKHELRGRVRSCGVASVRAENYDSVLTKWYDPHAGSIDFGLSLLEVLSCDAPCLRSLSFERLVVDEAQDLTLDYVRLLQKLLRDNAVPRERVQIVLVGDSKQALSGYRGASSKYLRGPEAYFNRPFERLLLHETFRFGSELCASVNRLLAPLFSEEDWGGDVVPGRPLPGAVHVWPAGPGHGGDGDGFWGLIGAYAECLRGAGSVAVLARSLLDGQSPALWDFLGAASSAGLEALRQEEEEEDGRGEDSDEEGRAASSASSPGGGTDNVVTTIHKSKGRAFGHVFVFLGRDLDVRSAKALSADARQLLYVACTRARTSLHLVYADTSRQEPPGRAGGLRGPPPPLPLATARPAGLFRRIDRDLHTTEKRVLAEWLKASGLPWREEPPRPRSRLRVSTLAAAAASLRLAFVRPRSGGGGVHGLFELLEGRGKGPAAWSRGYASLSRQRLPPAMMRVLAALPADDPSCWPAAAWLDFARLHAVFRNGQLATGTGVGAATDADVCAFDTMLRRCPDLEGFDVVHELRAGERALEVDSCRSLILASPASVLLLGMRGGGSVRFSDAVAAAYVASALGRRTACICYLAGDLRCAVDAPETMQAVVESLVERGRMRRAQAARGPPSEQHVSAGF